MILSMSVVYLCDLVAEWDLWPIATAQHYEKISYSILLAWEKNQNSKSEVQFLLKPYYSGLS